MILRILAAAALSLAALSASAVDVGQAAPELPLPAGAPGLKLADYRGKVVYLDFWASWCGPCRQSFPWMNELQEKYGKQGLTVIGVNVDQKRADADKFLAEVPARFTLAYDATGASPRTYAVKTMPSSVLIGPDGVVQVVHRGFRNEDKGEVEAAIRAALAKLPQK